MTTENLDAERAPDMRVTKQVARHVRRFLAFRLGGIRAMSVRTQSHVAPQPPLGVGFLVRHTQRLEAPGAHRAADLEHDSHAIDRIKAVENGRDAG